MDGYESDRSVDYDLIATEKLSVELKLHLRKVDPAKPLPKKTKSFREVMKRIIVGFMIGSTYATSFLALPATMVIYPFTAVV
jgi:hypothetical protein